MSLTIKDYSTESKNLTGSSERGEPVGCARLDSVKENSAGLELIPTNILICCQSDTVSFNISHKPLYLRNLDSGKWLKLDAKKIRLFKLRKKIFLWAGMFEQVEEHTGVSYVFQGVTYRVGEVWKSGDISNYLKAVRDSVEDGGILGYAWVAELQERGEVHYHILWAIKPHVFLPYPDKSGLWSHGNSHVSRRMSCKPYYICKYTSKLEQKTGLPKGAHLFGTYIRKGVLSFMEQWNFRMSNYPVWLRAEIAKNNFDGTLPKRVKGGGWLINEEEGIIVYSPWMLEGMPALVREEDVINVRVGK